MILIPGPDFEMLLPGTRFIIFRVRQGSRNCARWGQLRSTSAARQYKMLHWVSWDEIARQSGGTVEAINRANLTSDP
jgi:hypothetical protein